MSNCESWRKMVTPPVIRIHRREHPARFLARHHLWQPMRSARSRKRVQLPQRLVQHLPIQKHQCVQRLTLGGSRHLPLRRQVAQERRHLRFAQFARMPPSPPRRRPLPACETAETAQPTASTPPPSGVNNAGIASPPAPAPATSPRGWAPTSRGVQNGLLAWWATHGNGAS